MFTTGVFCTLYSPNYPNLANGIDYEILVRDREAKDTETKNNIGYLNCDLFSISEKVIKTNNPEHYLKYTIEGHPNKGGSLVIDSRYPQNSYSLTICGHNSEIHEGKLSSISDLWKDEIYEECNLGLYADNNLSTYKLWGAYRIDNSEVSLAYPVVNNEVDLSEYLENVKEKEGWCIIDKDLEPTSILILLTCSEAYTNAPHRTIAIFYK